MYHLLQVNAIIEYLEPESRKGEMLRILYIDPAGEGIIVFPLPGDKEFPYVLDMTELVDDLESDRAFIKPIDPYSPPKKCDSDLKEKHVARRDKGWNAIKKIAHNEPDIYDKDIRGRLIVYAADEAKTYEKSIYRYLRQYWGGGKLKNALLPDFSKCGGRGKDKSCNEGIKRGRPRLIKSSHEDDGVNVTASVKALIRKVANDFYNKSDEKSVRKCYTKLKETYFAIGHEEDRDGNKIPILPPAEEYLTIDQFRYWLKKILDIQASIIARKGRRTFNLNHRPVLKDSTSEAFGPGHIEQIDATIADTYLVSSLDRTKVIGRPILYFVMDVFSRMIVGFYIGLSGPNYLGAAMALENAASNKVEFCQRYGITIDEAEWPVAALPEYLVADRAELLSKQSDMLVNNFNMEILNTPSWRADLKGIVEQEFHRANEDVIHWMPGAVMKDWGQRGAKDPRLDAKLTLDEFTKIIIYMILNHNQSHHLEGYPLLPEMLADGVSPIPIELWEWGLFNRMGCLQTYTKNDLIAGLMPSGVASINKGGIKFRGRYYTCQKAEDEAWFTIARNSGVVNMKASYDPRRGNYIYLHPDHGGDLIECVLLEKSQIFTNHRDEDVELYWFGRKVQKRINETKVNQGKVSLESLSQSIIDEAITATEAAWEHSGFVSKLNRVKSVRDNRDEERIVRDPQEAFNPSVSKTPETNDDFHIDDDGEVINEQEDMLDILNGVSG